MKVTKLQKKFFEKYITSELFKKIATYLILSSVNNEQNEAVINIITSFIQRQIELYKQIKLEQIKNIYTLSEQQLESILDTEYKYHVINYTNEILNAILADKDYFHNYDNIEKYKQLYNEKVLEYIEDFIHDIFNDVNSIISNDNIENTLDSLFKEIIEIINLQEEIEKLNEIASDYEDIISKIDDDNSSYTIYSLLNNFKNIVQTSYIKVIENRISTLEPNKNVLEKHSIISFGNSILPDIISDYIIDQFEILKTGYSFIDNNIGGLESENIITIAAPSNHGKSLCLLQLAKGVITSNFDDFKQNDVILHITLEDNKVKLTRRIFTIFGNYHPGRIKQLYYSISKKAKQIKLDPTKTEQQKNELIDYLSQLSRLIFKYLEYDSIYRYTKNKVYYLIQDQADSSYSTTNLLNTLTILKLKKYNVKAIFLDYVDLMSSIKKFDKEYDEHGQIIKDLRAIAKEFHIPIITATQLKRETENPKVKLTNQTMGDSYKKVRFSDYILMIRQMYDMSITDLADTYPIHLHAQSTDELQKLSSQLIPVEYSFTKVKDTEKTLSSSLNNYLLFSKFNLNLYDNIEHLYRDFKNSIENMQLLDTFISYINTADTIPTIQQYINEISNLINSKFSKYESLSADISNTTTDNTQSNINNNLFTI